MALIRINENLVFDSINRILMSDKLPDRKKTLGLAAAFCLECLVEAQGQTVSQEKLIHEGWQKHGFEVSPGNVRQVISQIRKAFSSLKESPDILITVPKMGYRLNIQSAEQAEPDTSVSTSVPAHYQDAAAPAGDSAKLLTRRKKTIAAYVLAGLVVSASVLGAIKYFLPFAFSQATDVYYQAVPSKGLPAKKIMVDKRILKNRDFINASMELLVNSPFWKDDVKKYDWIYLNAGANDSTHTFFLCDRDVNETPLNCVSRIFIEE